MESGDAKSISDKTRQKWTSVSRKFGCLFGKNAASVKEKERMNLIDCKPGDSQSEGDHLVKVITGQSLLESKPGDSHPKADGIVKAKAQQKPHDPWSFCPCCDLNRRIDVANEVDYERLHDAMLCFPTQHVACFRVDDGSYPWKIIQIKMSDPRLDLPDWVEKSVYCNFPHSKFDAKTDNLEQAFIAVTKTEPCKILGLMVVTRMKWKLEYAVVFDESNVTETLSDHIAVSNFWVHSPSRRQGVARSMADAARKNFFPNSVVSKEKFGILSPTCYGYNFAMNYLDRDVTDTFAFP